MGADDAKFRHLLGSLIDPPEGHREKLRAGWPAPNARPSAQRCPAQSTLGLKNAPSILRGTRAPRSLTLRSVLLRIPPFEQQCLAIWQGGAGARTAT
jgi:hypothetical protein